jgi:hypothetical protein
VNDAKVACQLESQHYILENMEQKIIFSHTYRDLKNITGIKFNFCRKSNFQILLDHIHLNLKIKKWKVYSNLEYTCNGKRVSCNFVGSVLSNLSFI